MKTIFFFVSVLAAFNAGAQDKAVIKGDTLYYQNQKYYEGKEIQLSYGTGQNKAFAFVFLGTGFGTMTNAPSTMGKSSVLITEVKKYSSGKLVAICKVIDGKAPKVFIDIEGAVDNGELKQ